MSRIVMKFGGTSLGDIARIKSTAIRIKKEVSNGSSVIVIVSVLPLLHEH